jgi:hypothetical protein
LKLAVSMLGSEPTAREFLRAKAEELARWTSGQEEPPAMVLKRALDLILDDPALAARHAALLSSRARPHSAGEVASH